MAANPTDLILDSSPSMEDNSLQVASEDRRRRARLPLHLSVLFYRGDGTCPIEGTTQNISSEGFFCLLGASFSLGETLGCTVECPAYAPHIPESKLLITCRVKVVRVLPGTSHGVHGVACSILEFDCSYPR